MRASSARRDAGDVRRADRPRRGTASGRRPGRAGRGSAPRAGAAAPRARGRAPRWRPPGWRRSSPGWGRASRAGRRGTARRPSTSRSKVASAVPVPLTFSVSAPRPGAGARASAAARATADAGPRPGLQAKLRLRPTDRVHMEPHADTGVCGGQSPAPPRPSSTPPRGGAAGTSASTPACDELAAHHESRDPSRAAPPRARAEVRHGSGKAMRLVRSPAALFWCGRVQIAPLQCLDRCVHS